MTRVPIACTLAPNEAEDRGAEWRSFLAQNVEELQLDNTVARVRLRPGDQVLITTVDLAEREKACCGFFSFSIELDRSARWLRVEVPVDAAAILAELVSLPGA